MRQLIFDIETTGFNRTHDNIVSFAYLEFDKDMTKVLDSGVAYFYKKGMRWSMEAEAVHGLTREFLSQYEDDYSNNMKLLFKKVTKGNLVGYNNDVFDNSFISAFLNKEMYGPLNNNSSLDIMKLYQPVFGKRQKLGVLCEALGVNEFILNNLSMKWFNLPFGWHTSNGDVVATAFCYIEAKRRGII